MVDDELQPESNGTLREVSSYHHGVPERRVERMAQDIERHGEVHANFEHVEKEVECRLGTTKLNYQAGTIEVFDGDQWHPFAMSKLVDWDVPMDLYHG